MRLSLSIATLALVFSLAPVSAEATVALCLDLKAPSSQRPSLRKLIVDEIAHHPHHRLVGAGCEATLKVDFFVVDGVRYLTLRIGREIPLRFTYRKASALNEKISTAITRVLRNDPIYLQEDITHYSGVKRALHSILKRGHNRYRVELFQVVTTNGAEAVALPGGALSITRGSSHWQIYSRLYFAGDPSDAVNQTLLKLFCGADIGLTYELSARSTQSFYLSAGFGAQLLYYEGRLAPNDAGSEESAHRLGGTFSLRAGYRLFRASDFDLDLFTQGYLPLFKTRDPDSPLIDSYTPSIVFGVGVGF